MLYYPKAPFPLLSWVNKFYFAVYAVFFFLDAEFPFEVYIFGCF